MSARQDPTRREDLLMMLLHGGAASGSIARHVVDAAIAEATAPLLAERHSTNEALDDAVREVAQLRAAAEKVAGFCAQRAEYVTNLRNCNPNADHDYYRWTGHAEARRQLSHLLGLPVGWPAEDKPAPVHQLEDPHTSDLHHDYALGRDLPFIPAQTTGRCPQGHTFEDCTCGGAA